MGTKMNYATQFCPDCGTFLPAPGKASTVVCLRCGLKIPFDSMREFYTVGRKTVISFNKPREVMEQDVVQEAAPTGPKVDRKCQVCGHEQMAYNTKQTRSADEGQTIFYCCLKCKAVETEYS